MYQEFKRPESVQVQTTTAGTGTSIQESKTPEPVKTPPPVEPKKEKLDKSFVASLRRISKAWRAMGTFANVDAAKALDDEADLLDPDTEAKQGSKQGLQNQVDAAKTKVAAAETTLANPDASRADNAQASKDLKSA